MKKRLLSLLLALIMVLGMIPGGALATENTEWAAPTGGGLAAPTVRLLDSSYTEIKDPVTYNDTQGAIASTLVCEAFKGTSDYNSMTCKWQSTKTAPDAQIRH